MYISDCQCWVVLLCVAFWLRKQVNEWSLMHSPSQEALALEKRRARSHWDNESLRKWQWATLEQGIRAQLAQLGDWRHSSGTLAVIWTPLLLDLDNILLVRMLLRRQSGLGPFSNPLDDLRQAFQDESKDSQENVSISGSSKGSPNYIPFRLFLRCVCNALQIIAKHTKF